MKIVLIIDDDAIFRSIMRKHLERLGYTIAECNSGEFALNLVQRLHPVACIVDIFMDKKDGIETIEELAQLATRPKIIAVSSNNLYLEMAIDLGANAKLMKPVTPEVLEATLNAVLEQSGD